MVNNFHFIKNAIVRYSSHVEILTLKISRDSLLLRVCKDKENALERINPKLKIKSKGACKVFIKMNLRLQSARIRYSRKGRRAVCAHITIELVHTGVLSTRISA